MKLDEYIRKNRDKIDDRAMNNNSDMVSYPIIDELIHIAFKSLMDDIRKELLLHNAELRDLAIEEGLELETTHVLVGLSGNYETKTR